MAIITSGILGGIKGQLKDVIGYRRNGSSIIQSVSYHESPDLIAFNKSKHEYKKNLLKAFALMTSAQRNRVIFNSNAILPYHERLIFQWLNRIPFPGTRYSLNASIGGYTSTMPNNYTQKFIPSTNVIQSNFKAISKTSDITLAFRSYSLSINLVTGVAVFNNNGVAVESLQTNDVIGVNVLNQLRFIQRFFCNEVSPPRVYNGPGFFYYA